MQETPHELRPGSGFPDAGCLRAAAPMIRRRGMLVGAAALAGLPDSRAEAQPDAAAWPVRQTRIVIPFAAGGVSDVAVRIITERLSRRLRATFFSDNKPGAGGGLGALEVVRAAPDGATLLATSNSISILPILQPRLGLDPVRDFAPLSLICDLPAGVAVRTDSPIRDLADLIARAKAAPGRTTYGSGGVGSANHLATSLFGAMAGIEFTHVPYSGFARVLTAVYAGEVEFTFGSLVEILPVMRQGAVRLLGVTMPGRLPEIAEVPAIAERVPGYAVLYWLAFFAPKGTAPPLMERLASELALIRDDPELKARLAEGLSPVRLDGPAPLVARLSEDMARWRTVIARENIRPE